MTKTERRSSPFSATETQRRDCVTCRIGDLRPHPSYVKHQFSVSTLKTTGLQRLGDRAFLEPIAVTQDRIIIDGYARWELAKLRNIATVLCLEYRLAEDEALCFMLRKQQRSNGSNDFTRIVLALDLEPSLRDKARLNQQVGGCDKGSSMLTTVDRIDTRKEIARLAEVSLGNVTKAKLLGELEM